jgi:hypothetical protein
VADASLKRYLGDSVYVDFSYGQFVLTTEDGVRTTNTIFLEPEIYEALVAYVRDLKVQLEKPRPPPPTDPSRCSLDGAPRLFQNGRYTVCSLVSKDDQHGCKDPGYDMRREEEGRTDG